MAIRCSRCGAFGGDDIDGAPAPPLGWSTATDGARVQALCERCTREHVRDIEAKLDEGWWT